MPKASHLHGHDKRGIILKYKKILDFCFRDKKLKKSNYESIMPLNGNSVGFCAPLKLEVKPSHWSSSFKPYERENTIQVGRIQVERKIFSFQLRENANGRFLKISEGTSEWRNCIIIPASGLQGFQKTLLEMAEIIGKLEVEFSGNLTTQ